MPAPVPPALPNRRRWLAAGLAWPLGLIGPRLAGATQAPPLRDGDSLLLRHAHAPGFGDPPGFELGDCRSQRNLDATGRSQARRIGAALRGQGLPVRQLHTSRWCRARETAELIAAELGGVAVHDDARFDSFFADSGQGPTRTAAAREWLQRWSGPGLLLVVTHQVNIAALTGNGPASGEAVALRRSRPGASNAELVVLGRHRFD